MHGAVQLYRRRTIALMLFISNLSLVMGKWDEESQCYILPGALLGALRPDAFHFLCAHAAAVLNLAPLHSCYEIQFLPPTCVLSLLSSREKEEREV